MRYRAQDLVTLTHTCQAWREVFVSRSSLWTDFYCENAEKTRVYLERSKSSPINLWLYREGGLSPRDPFLKLVPNTVGRLRSLTIETTPEDLQGITSHLSRPALLLEKLDINIECGLGLQHSPVLAPTLLGGNLTSLCELRLQAVRTELPWRNMDNLTSFTLGYMLPGVISANHLLDFFESAPHLRIIELFSATPTSGARNGRLVSLAYLKRMNIIRGGPSSFLLNHLLIPIGAKLATKSAFRGPMIEDQLPGSLDNLRNLPNFTEVHLYVDEFRSRMRLAGPNGEVLVEYVATRFDITSLVLESLARFDTSKTQRLEISRTSPPSRDRPYQTLLPMRNLRTLKLTQCRNPRAFIHALHPGLNSLDVVVCPKLEELVFILCADREDFDTKAVIAMGIARASRGAKLRTVRIVERRGRVDPKDVVELRKHALHVEYGPGDGAVYGESDEDSDGSDEDNDGSYDED